MTDQRSGRFSIIPARAYDDPRIDNAAIRVLGILGCYSDKGGWCYPSVVSIAARTASEPRTVRKHLAALKDAGYLEARPRFRQDGSQTSNMYRIVFDQGEPDPALASDTEDEDAAELRTPPCRKMTPPLSRKMTPLGVSLNDSPRTSQPNAPKNDIGNSGEFDTHPPKQWRAISDDIPEPMAPDETPQKAPRARNPEWDALAEGIGMAPRTKTEIGQFASAVKELRQAGYSPDDIRRACDEHRRQWPKLTITASSVKKHISTLLAGAAKTTRQNGWHDSPELAI